MNEIECISQKLVFAVEAIMDQTSSADKRSISHAVVEDFKNNSRLCATCGFYLCVKENHHIIRHFGFQLIEHHIKLHWNDCTLDYKTTIKDSILGIIEKGTGLILDEPIHIKDAIGRIVVEIIKREWPQHWQNLLPELHQLCSMGPIQTEIVLLIFRRLAEDTVHLQLLSDQRKRDVYRSLCANMPHIFAFFVTTVNDAYENSNACSDPNDKEVCLHLAETSLENLCVYIEWIPINHIVEDTALLTLLYKLLLDERLRNQSVKCLLIFVEKKGPITERMQKMILFDENFMSLIYTAASAAYALDEANFMFLKQLCTILTSLGNQLCQVLGNVDEAKIPKAFLKYLKSILSFAKHPSISISHTAQILWLNLLSHQILSCNEEIQQILPELLEIEAKNLYKVGYPSQNNSERCEYSRLEFDDDDQFRACFCNFRKDVFDVVRLITQRQPGLTFSYLCTLIKSLLKSSEPKEIKEEQIDWDAVSHNSEAVCSEFKDEQIVWDAVSHYTDAVCSALLKKVPPSELEKLATEGVVLLKFALDYNSEDPIIISAALSLVSSLCVFLSYTPETVPTVLNKIFSIITFERPNEDKHNRSKEVKNLKRHACSMLICLATIHANLLVPAFDLLCARMKELFLNMNLLNLLERTTLMEVLMILSNEFNNYDKQSQFIADILSLVVNLWTSEAIQTALSSPENFLNYVGLNKEPKNADQNDPAGQNRADLMLCLHMFKGCTKRCVYPENVDVAKKGGFVHPSSEALNSLMFRNPAASTMMPILPQIFQLIRLLHLLYEPTIKGKIHQFFMSSISIDFDENERSSLFGTTMEELPFMKQAKHPTEKMKLFLQLLYDTCLHTLGRAAEYFGIDFYTIPDLSKIINETIVCSQDNLPDFNLKCYIRSFLKLVYSRCPPTFYNTVLEVLSLLIPFMYKKLSYFWDNYRERYLTRKENDDEMTEEQEILDDQLKTNLTREYITFIATILYTKPNIKDLTTENMEEEQANCGVRSLSDLGIAIINHESTQTAIVCTCFEGLYWMDSFVNANCVRYCDSIFKQMYDRNMIVTVEDANFLLRSTLQGLRIMGEHETNQGMLINLALMVYENLTTKFPHICKYFQQLTECNACDLEAFEKTLNGQAETFRVKKKRDKFKNLLSKVIGKNIGQQFKTPVVIKNLPRLFRHRSKTASVDESNEPIGICKLFESNGTKS